MIDVAKAKGVKHLPSSYTGRGRLQDAEEQGSGACLETVLIRTGLMTLWPDQEKPCLLDKWHRPEARNGWSNRSRRCLSINSPA